MKDLLFSADYTGPRYRYGVTLRPALGYNIPAGCLIGSAKFDSRFAHGTIEYPEPLPEDVVWRFDLVPDF